MLNTRYILGIGILAVGLLGAKPASAQTLIDTFDLGMVGTTQTATVNSGGAATNPVNSIFATSNALGGQRNITTTRNNGTAQVKVTVNDTDSGQDGRLDIEQGSSTNSTVLLQYLVPGAAKNFTANDVWGFSHFGGSNQGATIEYRVFTGAASSVASKVLTAGTDNDPILQSLQFSSFVGGADFTNVTKLEIRITGSVNNSDSYLTLLQTTNAPEPVSALLFLPGLAGAGLLKLRKRRK